MLVLVFTFYVRTYEKPITFPWMVSNITVRDLSPPSSVQYVLSVIAISEEVSLSKLLPELERWLVEDLKMTLLARLRTINIAIANVEIPLTELESLLQSLKGKQEFFRITFHCDVNLCPGGLSSWWFNSNLDGNSLFVFDLDSTLIEMECIEEIARMAGVYDQVAVVYLE